VAAPGQARFCLNMMVFIGFCLARSIMTAGTVFLMWIGEQIDAYGIGNGISLVDYGWYFGQDADHRHKVG
jgi:preprotein translocase subunit SecY